ncbi:hypothetical protein Pla163_04830 [Planctomycetes bacterium Pla163]|uniref:Chromosome partition protein Smc n=1 Tax=Rohdeia mirabilis TaxID=2528008 RepID=A0A518CW05_9BACT|nr:hypothetical protein Pla163_04830 [Planctomycetes bacterium Pla163]
MNFITLTASGLAALSVPFAAPWLAQDGQSADVAGRLVHVTTDGTCDVSCEATDGADRLTLLRTSFAPAQGQDAAQEAPDLRIGYRQRLFEESRDFPATAISWETALPARGDDEEAAREEAALLQSEIAVLHARLTSLEALQAQVGPRNRGLAAERSASQSSALLEELRTVDERRALLDLERRRAGELRAHVAQGAQERRALLDLERRRDEELRAHLAHGAAGRTHELDARLEQLQSEAAMLENVEAELRMVRNLEMIAELQAHAVNAAGGGTGTHELDARLVQLQSEAALLEAHANALETRDLWSQLDTRKAATEDAVRELLTALQPDAARAQGRLEWFDARSDDEEERAEDLREYEQELAELERESQRIEKRAERLEKRLAKAVEKNRVDQAEELEDELAELHEELAELDEERAELDSELAALDGMWAWMDSEEFEEHWPDADGGHDIEWFDFDNEDVDVDFRELGERFDIDLFAGGGSSVGGGPQIDFESLFGDDAHSKFEWPAPHGADRAAGGGHASGGGHTINAGGDVSIGGGDRDAEIIQLLREIRDEVRGLRNDLGEIRSAPAGRGRSNGPASVGDLFVPRAASPSVGGGPSTAPSTSSPFGVGSALPPSAPRALASGGSGSSPFTSAVPSAGGAAAQGGGEFPPSRFAGFPAPPAPALPPVATVPAIPAIPAVPAVPPVAGGASAPRFLQ